MARACSTRRLFLSFVILIVFVVVVFTVLMGFTAYTFMSKTNANKENVDRRDKSSLTSNNQLNDLNEKFERNAMNWFKETLRQSFFQFSNNFNQYEQDFYKNDFENESGNWNCPNWFNHLNDFKYFLLVWRWLWNTDSLSELHKHSNYERQRSHTKLVALGCFNWTRRP